MHNGKLENLTKTMSGRPSGELPAQDASERMLWEAYPSWGQFSWLYFLSLWTASRGLIFLYAEVPGWGLWMVGASVLLGVAAILRFWAKYSLTAQQVIIRNGYFGTIIRCASHKTIWAVEVMQGPLAKIFGMGTVVIECDDPNQTIRFRGIKDPEIIVNKLRALLPASSPVFNQTL